MENRWMALGLAVVLALQVYTLAQVRELKQFSRQVGDVRSQISQIGHRVNSLDNQLTMMARANEWVVNPRVRVESGAGCTEAVVSADWTLKEVDPGAEVSFLYRSTREQEWQAARTVPTGDGGFRASFAVEGSVAASPSIQVEGPAGRGSATRVTETAQAPRPGYEYRIVSRSGERTRSSEPRSLDVNRVFVAHFRISALARPDGYRVNLTRNRKPDTSECTAVTEARVRGIAGGRVVAESPLKADANPEMMWADLTSKEAMDRLEVVVRYGAGNEETHTVDLTR